MKMAYSYNQILDFGCWIKNLYIKVQNALYIKVQNTLKMNEIYDRL